MSEGPDHPGNQASSSEDESLESLRVRVAEALEPDFELLRTLGSGEAAHVFLAREPALQRLVAVKVLRAEAGIGETVRARFEREAHLAAGIRHPGVPAVHRVGRLARGLPFAVQEYVEGRTLRDRLETAGAVPPAETRKILADLAAALAAAHEAGVIHRDVRPENVILARDKGRAVLTDFGLAAVQETGAQTGPKLTREGEILGDPRYASPEQLRGEPVTGQTDVYSLGVLGYEMLTLSNPFGSRSRGQLIADHLEGAPRELPIELTDADPRTAEILARCLAKDPARRPRAEEVERALSESETSGPSAELPGGAWSDSVLAPFPRVAAFVSELRRRRVYQVAAAYVVIVFVVLQAAELVLSGLAAPSWVFSTLVVGTLASFPVVVVLAWIFDVTGGGIRRTEPAPGDATRAYKIAGLLASVGAAVVLGWLLLR